MSPWRHLFAEGAYGARDQVIGHGSGLEDHGNPMRPRSLARRRMVFASVSALPTITCRQRRMRPTAKATRNWAR